MKRWATTLAALAVLATLAVAPAAAQTIGWANLQWPPTYTGTSCSGDGIYGQVWIDGVTSDPGQTPGLRAHVGFGPDGTPAGAGWIWIEAEFNVDAGNNDEFVLYLDHYIEVGVYDYAYRYTLDDGASWYYADLDGPSDGNFANPGAADINQACGAVDDDDVSWGAVKALYR